jgi:hypothetical protein
MEGFLMVIFLSITMLIGSFLSGMVPLTLSLSEVGSNKPLLMYSSSLIRSFLRFKEQDASHYHSRRRAFDRHCTGRDHP